MEGRRTSSQRRGAAASPGDRRRRHSLEQLGVVDADLVVMTFDSDGTKNELRQLPLLAQLPSVQAGRDVPIDLDVASALRLPNRRTFPLPSKRWNRASPTRSAPENHAPHRARSSSNEGCLDMLPHRRSVHPTGEWIGDELRLAKRPIRWCYRPLTWPVWNHEHRRLVRFWSATEGLDADVIEALRTRRLDRLTVVEPSDDELAERVREELTVTRRHLRTLTLRTS